MTEHDRWHRWLLDVRFGGDAAYRERDLADFLYPVRDNVLDKARLQPGNTLLDVGTGDGLIAFGALERIGASGHVIFSDISRDLLDHCREAAAAEGLLDRCAFLQAAADSLADVDVVTTRSVLIYVKDKAAALREFFRVLRPGGRVSLFEPINALMSECDSGRLSGYDVRPVAAIAAKLQALCESIQPPGTDPMVDFDERDLVRLAQDAGFSRIDLELRVTVDAAKPPVPWERFVRMSGNPLIPPLAEAMASVLSPPEIAEFGDYLRPQVEAGIGQDRSALAYLTGSKT